MQREGAQTLYVEKGSDSADLRIANLAGKGDIVLTQDYGLAALALARGAKALNQNGLIFTADNIDALLLSRHTAARIRRGGGRLKGPPKRTPDMDDAFLGALTRLLSA